MLAKLPQCFHVCFYIPSLAVAFFWLKFYFLSFPLSLSAPLIVQHVYARRRMMALFSHFVLSNAEILLFYSDNQERENETDCAIKRTKKLNDASNQINVLLCIQHKISYYVHIDNTERATVFQNTKPTH